VACCTNSDSLDVVFNDDDDDDNNDDDEDDDDDDNNDDDDSFLYSTIATSAKAIQLLLEST
jgi:hypothetical protein